MPGMTSGQRWSRSGADPDRYPPMAAPPITGSNGAQGAVLEVLTAAGPGAGKQARVLHKVHLAILAGVQDTHELIVVTLPKLCLCRAGMAG